jgi:ankyrin repeat protein
VRFILQELKADPNVPKNDERRPAVVAAAAGNYINILREIAKAPGCNVDAAGPGGYTSCYSCAQYGLTACLRVLLELGADPNQAILDGTTPAMKASTNKHVDCLNLLIDYGCDPHHVKDGMLTQTAALRVADSINLVFTY